MMMLKCPHWVMRMLMIYIVQCIANPGKHKHTHCITVEQVKFAINKLKPGKSDSTDGLLSDNF